MGEPSADPLTGALELIGARAADLDAADRRAGVVYTPWAIAEALVEEAFCCLGDARRSGEGTVCWESVQILDPAAGAGVLLLAAAEALARRGVPRAAIASQLHGRDVDPTSVAVCRSAIEHWAGVGPPDANVVVANTLGESSTSLTDPVPRFDLVVSNPPFASPLSADAARSEETASVLHERFGDAVHRYLDLAGLFVLAGWELVADAGVLCYVLPQSMLGAADAAPLRTRLDEEGRLVSLWVSSEPVFPEVAVDVCAPVIVRSHDPAGGVSGQVRRHRGSTFEPFQAFTRRDDSHGRWSAVAAELFGVPPVALRQDHGRLADLCRATAGFRDQFYGLRGAVVESEDPERETRPRLCTSGLIDPARCRWGVEPARFDRATWRAPVIDTARLAEQRPDVARWGEAVAHPKVVVATQTRVLEAVADEQGLLWPSVPTIAVLPEPEDLLAVLAVVLAPPITAWAYAEVAGAALAADALKISARKVLEIPLPLDQLAWSEGARLLAQDVIPAGRARQEEAWRSALEVFGRCMCDAYRVDDDLARWWHARVPNRRPAGSRTDHQA